MKGQLKSSFSIASLLGSSSSEDTVSSSAAVVTSHTDRTSCHLQGQTTSTVPDTPPSSPRTPPHVLVPSEHRLMGSISSPTNHPRTVKRSPCEPGIDTGSLSPSYRKNARMNYTSGQIARLEAVYQTTPYPDADMYDILSDELNLPAKKLKVWFQNKRARNKRRVSDISPTNFPPFHSVYLSQLAPGLQAPPGLPAMPSFPYLMSGLMMSQPSVIMTPPTSPVDAKTIMHPYLAFAPGVNMLPYAQSTSTSGSP